MVVVQDLLPGFVVIHGVSNPCLRIVQYLGSEQQLIVLADIFRTALARLHLDPAVLAPIRHILAGTSSDTRQWYLSLSRRSC